MSGCWKAHSRLASSSLMTFTVKASAINVISCASVILHLKSEYTFSKWTGDKCLHTIKVSTRCSCPMDVIGCWPYSGNESTCLTHKMFKIYQHISCCDLFTHCLQRDFSRIAAIPQSKYGPERLVCLMGIRRSKQLFSLGLNLQVRVHKFKTITKSDSLLLAKIVPKLQRLTQHLWLPQLEVDLQMFRQTGPLVLKRETMMIIERIW